MVFLEQSNIHCKEVRIGMEEPGTLCASKYFSGIEEIIDFGILQLGWHTPQDSSFKKVSTSVTRI